MGMTEKRGRAGHKCMSTANDPSRIQLTRNDSLPRRVLPVEKGPLRRASEPLFVPMEWH